MEIYGKYKQLYDSTPLHGLSIHFKKEKKKQEHRSDSENQKVLLILIIWPMMIIHKDPLHPFIAQIQINTRDTDSNSNTITTKET